jgi:hypothetical protein
MKRHDRPYGCTFSACNKTFGSKHDWKRHENSRHIFAQAGPCEEDLEGGFWCGFCQRLIDLKEDGSPGMSDSTTSMATLWDILDLLSEISRIGFL